MMATVKADNIRLKVENRWLRQDVLNGLKGCTAMSFSTNKITSFYFIFLRVRCVIFGLYHTWHRKCKPVQSDLPIICSPLSNEVTLFRV